MQNALPKRHPDFKKSKGYLALNNLESILVGLTGLSFYKLHMLWIYFDHSKEKNDNRFFFKNCCTGMFRFFYIAEFNLDKNLLNHPFPSTMVKIWYLFLPFFKERRWELLIPRKKILFSNTPPPISLNRFSRHMFVIRERCCEHTAIFLAAFWLYVTIVPQGIGPFPLGSHE